MIIVAFFKTKSVKWKEIKLRSKKYTTVYEDVYANYVTPTSASES